MLNGAAILYIIFENILSTVILKYSQGGTFHSHPYLETNIHYHIRYTLSNENHLIIVNKAKIRIITIYMQKAVVFNI